MNEAQNFPQVNQSIIDSLLYNSIPMIQQEVGEYQTDPSKVINKVGKTIQSDMEMSSRDSSPQGVNLLAKKKIMDSKKQSLMSFKIQLLKNQNN